MKNLFRTVVLFTFCSIILSCDDNNVPEKPKQRTIAEIASTTTNLSILVRALTRTDLVGVVSGAKEYTVFAPTNDAFNAFFTAISVAGQPATTVENVQVDVLKSILLNHVIGLEVKSANMPAAAYAPTLSPINATAMAPTISMYIQKAGTAVTVNGGSSTGTIVRKGATVLTPDVDAINGVIHIVDAVIQIPTILDHAANNPNFSTLVSVVTSTTGAFGNQSAVATALRVATAAAPLTVFAPTNTAFAEAQAPAVAPAPAGFLTGSAVTAANVTRVLQYHVLAGNVRSLAITSVLQILPTMAVNPVLSIRVQLNPTPRITDTQNVVTDIIAVDVQGSNGVIHAVNKVLRPF
jgi:uncharacterized surface protein with fasciclin (FAS1) repeats